MPPPPENTFKSRVAGLLDSYGEYLGKAFVVVNVVTAITLIRRFWPDYNRDAFLTIVGLAGGLLAAIQLQIIERIFGRHIPVFTLRSPFDAFLWGLIALVFAAAIFASRDERSHEAAVARWEAERKVERAERERVLHDPDVQRGMQLMNEIAERKAATQAATQTATRATTRRAATAGPTPRP
jgi:hypothetical protein